MFLLQIIPLWECQFFGHGKFMFYPKLIYFHLEQKILLNIPDSLLDTALALRGKEGENYKLISVWNLVTIRLKHGNSKSFYHGKLKTWLSICNLAEIF